MRLPRCFAVCALQACASLCVHAQAGAYSIAGTVVNELTGEPVRGATVAALTEEDSKRVASALTSNDGRFSLDGLPAAKYQLTASKRGYATAAYDEHGDYSSAIVTAADQDTTHLVFRLTPGGVLRGVVTADGGDPAVDAQVMLFKKPESPLPGAKIEQQDTAVTDDTGAYEFGNLAAGEYLLAVKAMPWYAMHGGGSGQAAASKPALDVAYPVTYFDSTTDEASASPIALAGGTRVEADVSLHAVAAVRLEVSVARLQDGRLARPELRQFIFGEEDSGVGVGYENTQQGQATEFIGVAPGQYELTQGDPARVVELDANTSQQVEPGAGLPAYPVSGTLQTADGGRFDGAAVATLEPADASQGLKPMESGFERGAFHFPAVPVGAWKLRAEVGGLPETVLSSSIAGKTQAGSVVTVQDHPLTLIARITAGGMTVEGFARKDGKGVAGAMILLIPADASAFQEKLRVDQSDSDGSFSLRDAAPGKYTVVAILGGWGLDWARSEVLARYLPGGIPVTVQAATEKTVRLAGPVPVQSR